MPNARASTVRRCWLPGCCHTCLVLSGLLWPCLPIAVGPAAGVRTNCSQGCCCQACELVSGMLLGLCYQIGTTSSQIVSGASDPIRACMYSALRCTLACSSAGGVGGMCVQYMPLCVRNKRTQGVLLTAGAVQCMCPIPEDISYHIKMKNNMQMLR